MNKKANTIFFEQDTVIYELINRIMNCEGVSSLCVYGDASELRLEKLYPAFKVKTISEFKQHRSGILFAVVSNDAEAEDLISHIQKTPRDVIVYCPDRWKMSKHFSKITQGYPLNKVSAFRGKLFLFGSTFQPPINYHARNDFKVLAIMHFYNEEDVLERTVNHLLKQGIDVYLLDNWSTDQSYHIAQRLQKKHPTRIILEQFPSDGGGSDYLWYNQLNRTEEIAREQKYDWFLHYDADEIRVSPWKNLTLRDTLCYMDSLGYNCIENTVVDFRITNEYESIFGKNTFFDFRHKPNWIDQLKTWKKTKNVDLKSSGGHHAVFSNPKIFPLKILNRHYPMRSLHQAEIKVLKDRKPRFVKEHSVRGWHGHYEAYNNQKDFIFDKDKLLFWDRRTRIELYIPLFTECGIRREYEPIEYDIPKMSGKRIAIWGAGQSGRAIYPVISKTNKIVLWVDKGYKFLPKIYGHKIKTPKSITDTMVDTVLISVVNQDAQKEIIDYLIQRGLNEKNICCVRKH